MIDITTPSVEGKTIASYLETEGLAKAHELIAKGGEEQLNRAIYILKHVPGQASASTLIAAEAKLKKRRKGRIATIAAVVALIVAGICAPFVSGIAQDQRALSDRLKPDVSENPVVISYDDREFENLCAECIDKALGLSLIHI